MLISMQGNWTITVKSKSAAFPQRFLIIGSESSDNTYDGVVGAPALNVTGDQWSISIQNDDGSGFQMSDTKINFPTKTGNIVSFDIRSNDAGADSDFNDLVLTCTSAFSESDFLIYGNVTKYSGCLINPCFRRWVVIDTLAGLREALKNKKLKEVIEKLYPERIPIGPVPGDPGPLFKPMMINIQDDIQIPAKLANVLTRTADTGINSRSEASESNLVFDKTAVFSGATSAINNRFIIDKVAISKIADAFRLRCQTFPASNITLSFEEYDRTSAELAGGPYTGSGNRTMLGSAITDQFGNYIFRYRQSLLELADEVNNDIAAGENAAIQVLPDIIVKINQLAPFFTTLYESAPYFNTPTLKRVDLCLPASKMPPSSVCFNGNLIGSLGNIFVGGAQNVTASTLPAALDRNGYNNRLWPDGKVSVRNSQAVFAVDCACWSGVVDVFGCMFNIRRAKNDPVIRHYTIRYQRAGTSNWEFVKESYLHPQFSKRFLPNYNGDLVGPFPIDLHTNGNGNPKQTVPAYKNIQAEINLDGVDWDASHSDRYMQLNTNIYDWFENDHKPGLVYFRVDGWDENGLLISSATDLIGLFINNMPLDFGLGTVDFTSDIELIPCGLYKMVESELNTPLELQFKVNDLSGFVNQYKLWFDKCPNRMELTVSPPLPLIVDPSSGATILKTGENAGNTNENGCLGYTGTLDDFGTTGYVTLILQPGPGEAGWLKVEEEFATFSVSLEASRRATNGYNSGIGSPSPQGTSFHVIRK